MTERIPLVDARRKTGLASVSRHFAGGFVLDRSVFHAWDPAYGHRQPCDRGHVLVEGSGKAKVHRVSLERGVLVHRTESALPPVGARVQLHLDAPRRDVQARAHTLMHVMMAAVGEARLEHVDAPEVVGGGEAKLHVRARDVARLEARVRELLATRAPVEVAWVPRDELARRATPQAMRVEDVAPGEPTLRVVRMGDWSVLPCDAPLVDAVWNVGNVRFLPPQPTREGTRWRGRVV